MKKEIRGLIVSKWDGPQAGIYIVESGRFGRAFATEFPSNTNATVRYAIKKFDDWPETLDEVAADTLAVLDGQAQSDYGDRYSEITGYLWTDEEAKIGGHDLIKELYDNTGKYLWMEIEYEY